MYAVMNLLGVKTFQGSGIYLFYFGNSEIEVISGKENGSWVQDSSISVLEIQESAKHASSSAIFTKPFLFRGSGIDNNIFRKSGIRKNSDGNLAFPRRVYMYINSFDWNFLTTQKISFI